MNHWAHLYGGVRAPAWHGGTTRRSLDPWPEPRARKAWKPWTLLTAANESVMRKAGNVWVLLEVRG